MATPAELAFERTNLDDGQLDHLQRLLGTWGILADLSFSDLVLLAPMSPGPDGEHLGDKAELVVLGQMRPSNSATVVQYDLVGQTVASADWPLAVNPPLHDQPQRSPAYWRWLTGVSTALGPRPCARQRQLRSLSKFRPPPYSTGTAPLE